MQVIFGARVRALRRVLQTRVRLATNEWIDYASYVEPLPPGGGALGLFERRRFAGVVSAEPVDVPDGRVAPVYFSLRVDVDVEGAVARLDAAGAVALGPLAPRSCGERAAWFADRLRSGRRRVRVAMTIA